MDQRSKLFRKKLQFGIIIYEFSLLKYMDIHIYIYTHICINIHTNTCICTSHMYFKLLGKQVNKMDTDYTEFFLTPKELCSFSEAYEENSQAS